MRVEVNFSHAMSFQPCIYIKSFHFSLFFFMLKHHFSFVKFNCYLHISLKFMLLVINLKDWTHAE